MAACSWCLLSSVLFCLLAGKCSGASSNIAVNSIAVSNDNSTISLAVSYTATVQPSHISWILPHFPATGGIKNLEFEQEDTFSDGHGRTVARMRHDVALTQPSRALGRLLILRNQDCEVTLHFPTFSDLMARPSFTQNLGGLGLTFKRRGLDLEPGAEVVFEGRENIQVVVSSPQLSQFSLRHPTLSQTWFELRGAGMPERVRKYSMGHYSKTVGVSLAGEWTGGETEKRLALRFSRPHTAILKLYDLTLEWEGGPDRVVEKVSLQQNLYQLAGAGSEVLPPDTVHMDTEHSHYFNDYDMPVSRYVPHISFNVYGNPRPSVTLYRACSEVVPAEAEVMELREESRYQVITFFEFTNVTEALSGSYMVVVRSGQMETREILSVGLQ